MNGSTLLSTEPANGFYPASKAKAVPLQAMEALGEKGGIVPTHS
jgi:hypothetical protein